MDKNRRDREQHDKDLQRLNALHAELWNITNAWMGLGIQRQRKEAIKIEQAVIRTRMADRLRLLLSEEKKSDGAAVEAAPDHAHDQADGNFGGGGFGGGCVTIQPAKGFNDPAGHTWAICPVCHESFEHLTLPHGHVFEVPDDQPLRVYYRPATMAEECRRYTESDRRFMKSLRITLDDPAESGKM